MGTPSPCRAPELLQQQVGVATPTPLGACRRPNSKWEWVLPVLAGLRISRNNKWEWPLPLPVGFAGGPTASRSGCSQSPCRAPELLQQQVGVATPTPCGACGRPNSKWGADQHAGGTAQRVLGEPAGQARRTDYLRERKNPNRQNLVGEKFELI
jgi:hypothetical protein